MFINQLVLFNPKLLLSMCHRYTWVTGKEPLTYYDMNLSAQDHQTFFTGDTQQLRPEDAGGVFKLCLNWINSVEFNMTFYMFCKFSVSSLSSCSDAESLEGEKSSSQDQSSLPGHRNQPRVSHGPPIGKTNSSIFFLIQKQTKEKIVKHVSLYVLLCVAWAAARQPTCYWRRRRPRLSPRPSASSKKPSQSVSVCRALASRFAHEASGCEVAGLEKITDGCVCLVELKSGV